MESEINYKLKGLSLLLHMRPEILLCMAKGDFFPIIVKGENLRHDHKLITVNFMYHKKKVSDPIRKSATSQILQGRFQHR